MTRTNMGTNIKRLDVDSARVRKLQLDILRTDYNANFLPDLGTFHD